MLSLPKLMFILKDFTKMHNQLTYVLMVIQLCLQSRYILFVVGYWFSQLPQHLVFTQLLVGGLIELSMYLVPTRSATF